MATLDLWGIFGLALWWRRRVFSKGSFFWLFWNSGACGNVCLPLRVFLEKQKRARSTFCLRRSTVQGL